MDTDHNDTSMNYLQQADKTLQQLNRKNKDYKKRMK